MNSPLTVDRILTSDGKTPQRAQFATAEHRANAQVLCDRVNALLDELGIPAVEVNDGFRDQSVTYGAPLSAHKQGQAVDLKDHGFAISNRVTQELRDKHKLRREDNDSTPTWCHLDTRGPPYKVFKP